MAVSGKKKIIKRYVDRGVARPQAVAKPPFSVCVNAKELIGFHQRR
jgi:hypothetical protein